MSGVTIKDIARALNIDPSTVSSCLSGNAVKRRISPERVEEVRQKAEEMGYIPNKLASRIFRRNSKKYLGLVIKNDSAGARVLPVLDFVLSELNLRDDCDFSVLYAPCGDLYEAVREGIGMGIRDFIIVGYVNGSELTGAGLERFPDIRIYAPDYSFDASDREFPFVVSKSGFVREVYFNALAAFLERGCGPVCVVQAYDGGGEIPPAEPGKIFYRVDHVKNLFALGAEVIAPMVRERFWAGACRTVIFRNDSVAIGVMNRMLEWGVKVPEELAIIGFNNSPFAAYARVPLTSVFLPLLENVRIMIGCILEDRELPPVTHSVPTLILRDSTPQWDWTGFAYPVASSEETLYR